MARKEEILSILFVLWLFLCLFFGIHMLLSLYSRLYASISVFTVIISFDFVIYSLFCSFFSVKCNLFLLCDFKLFLVTTSGVDTRLVFYLASFNHDGERLREVGVTCRCHLSKIMPWHHLIMMVREHGR